MYNVPVAARTGSTVLRAILTYEKFTNMKKIILFAMSLVKTTLVSIMRKFFVRTVGGKPVEIDPKVIFNVCFSGPYKCINFLYEIEKNRVG